MDCTFCSLDTGRLNAETYRLFDAVEKHYGIRIEYTFPDAQETVDLVREKGMFSFYEDGHQECCRVRKVLCICPSSCKHAPCLAAKQCCQMQAGTPLRAACLLGSAGQSCVPLCAKESLLDQVLDVCCLEQVRPLRRQLKGLKAWITGQRKDQSPGTRAAVPVLQVDPVFEGQAGGQNSLVKYNPLSNVSSQEVWNFLRVMVRLTIHILL